MRGLFIPGITTEMFMNGCLESIEKLMAYGLIYDIEYSLEQAQKDDRVKTELSGIKAELKQDAGGDYISRAFLIDRLLEKVKTQRSTIEIVDKLIPLIKELPSVTLQESKADIQAGKIGR